MADFCETGASLASSQGLSAVEDRPGCAPGGRGAAPRRAGRGSRPRWRRARRCARAPRRRSAPGEPALDLVEVPPHVRPAEGQRHRAARGEARVAGIAVDLQHAGEAGEMRDRPLVLAVGRVDIGDRRRLGPAPGPVVAGIGPELAGLGPPAAGIEHRRRRLVGEQLGRGLQSSSSRSCTGLSAKAARPTQSASVERSSVDALAGVDLGLAVERQVVGVLGDQHVRDQRLGRQAALDQPRRRRRLDDRLGAGAAGVLRAGG